MASKYSIVQYVPNPIADERINIGVVAFNENEVRVRFLKNWERVRHFGREDISFLKDFARGMFKAAESGLIFPGDNREASYQERLNQLTRNWLNSIQFTQPRGSLEDVDSLLEDIVANYLIEATSQKLKLRDRQDAARITTSKIRNVLQQQFKEEAKELLKIGYTLHGSHDEHKFDAVVANGKPYLAAHGISFEVQIQDNLQKLLSYMILDVKNKQPKLPIVIVALPPKKEISNYQETQKIYEQATSTYSELGAQVIEENEVESWVSENLKDVEILHSL